MLYACGKAPRICCAGRNAAYVCDNEVAYQQNYPMPTRINLSVDLQRNVVPISKAASSLATLIKRASSTGQPVIVTQKGYPTGVILPVDIFSALKDLTDDSSEPTASDDIVAALPKDTAMPAVHEEAPQETVESQRPVRGRRKRTIA